MLHDPEPARAEAAGDGDIRIVGRIESDRLRLVSAEKVGQSARLVYPVTPDTTATGDG